MELDIESEYWTASAIQNPIVGFGVSSTFILKLQLLGPESFSLKALERALRKAS